MDVLTVDLTPWAKKNMSLSPEGDLQVRPGAHQVFDFSTLDVVHGFSIYNPYTLESWHYIFYLDSGLLYLRIYDEDWGVIQRLRIPADRVPRDITHAVVNEIGQVVIASPDFATLWGMVGSGVRPASKVDSATGLTAVPIPRGLVAPWANRVVMATGNLLYVGDPIAIDEGDARSFIPQNILSVDAPIIGLHNAQDDLLIVVTTDGVWGLPGESASTAIVAQSEGRLLRLQDYDGVSYRSSCEVRNKVYGLTREGFRRLDAVDSPGVRISDPVVSSRQTKRMSFEDYRDFQMLAGPDGPIITRSDLDQFLYTDVEELFLSWWSLNSENHIKGVLRRSDGEELFLTESLAHYFHGNFDGDYDSTTEDAVSAAILLRAPAPPAWSGVLRRVLLHTDSFRAVTVSARHKTHTHTPPAQLDMSIIGTGVWGSTGDPQLEPMMQTVRVDTALRTDDLAIEIVVKGAGRRIGRSVDLMVVPDARMAE